MSTTSAFSKKLLTLPCKYTILGPQRFVGFDGIQYVFMYLEKLLENFNLNQKQAKTYLACLELGPSSVLRISQKAVLPRSTTYEVLNSLRQQGLVSTFRKKNIKYFTAEEPQKIINKIKNKTKLLIEALPQLEAAQYKAKNQPVVRFYQGKQEIKNILEKTLQEAREIVAFTSVDDIFSTLEYFFPKFVQKRVKKKIPVRVILRESSKARERKTSGPQELRQVKIMPSKYEHHGVMLMWGDKTAILSLKEELTAVIIESKQLTAIQIATFNCLWDSLPD